MFLPWKFNIKGKLKEPLKTKFIEIFQFRKTFSKDKIKDLLCDVFLKVIQDYPNDLIVSLHSTKYDEFIVSDGISSQPSYKLLDIFIFNLTWLFVTWFDKIRLDLRLFRNFCVLFLK